MSDRPLRDSGASRLETGSNMADQLSKTASDARETLSQTAGQLKDQAARQAETRKEAIADRVDGTASNVHQTAEALREGHQGWLADLVDRGAEELGEIAGTLRTNDLQGLLSQVESFARRQPALFAGASIAAGFALARMARVAIDQGSRPASAGSDLPASTTGSRATPASAPANRPVGEMYHG